jgi:putative transcriptional regulator
MPIRVHLDLMLVKRRMKLLELARAVDISLPNLSILKTNKARAIRFTTLDAICRALDCQPGDLLEYVDEETGAGHDAGDARTKPTK